MGNSISNDTLIPSSLPACIDKDGNFSTELYFLYRRGQEMQATVEELDEVLDQCIATIYNDDDNDDDNQTPPKPRSRGCFRRNLNRRRNNLGEIISINARDSSWYTMYVSSPNISSNKFHDRFRRRFRCKYESYLKLLQLISDEPLFKRWLQRDAAGRLPSPIELMLLGALHGILVKGGHSTIWKKLLPFRTSVIDNFSIFLFIGAVLFYTTIMYHHHLQWMRYFLT
jgi:hypothetical protein